MKWWPGECTSGDAIRIRIGSIYHYGIFVSEEEVIQFGLPPVDLASRKDEDIRVLSTDIEAFALGNIVEVAKLSRLENRRRFSPEQTVERARARIGEGGYSLIHNNCEHFINECLFGQKSSQQIDEIRRKWNERSN